MTTATIPAIEMDEPAPVFAVESRETALATLRRIGHSAGQRVDEYKAGHYSVFVPGRLALLVDEPSACAWLCTTTVDGRLATLEASAVWGGER